MDIITDPRALQDWALRWRAQGEKICLVPTMGYFHAGHARLMQEGRKSGEKLIVSRFINPAQFGPSEDLQSYPSDESRDVSIARNAGVDVLFMPKAEDMYRRRHSTWVQVPELGKVLCGKTRPTHFQGVCTVVSKLFLLALPHVAIFGEKDWQQLAILRRMVLDLNFPVEIVGIPIVREADGLALSSRNAYLNDKERAQAPHLNKGLLLANRLYAEGEKKPTALCAAVRQYWQENMPDSEVDYLEIVHPETLVSLDQLDSTPALAVAAVHVGKKARLLDNRIFAPRGQ